MDLLLQLQADQLGVPVTRPVSQELTALGAAYLAGLAEGLWDSPGAVSDRWQAETTFAPNPDRVAADQGYGRWLQAVDRSRGWVPS